MTGTRCSRSSARAPSPASRGSRARPIAGPCCRTACTGTVEVSHLPDAAQPRGDHPLPLGARAARTSSPASGACSTWAPISRRSARIWRRTRCSRRLIAERPGLRAPGAWDGFELAVRAVLGQQVTVEAGAQARSRLAQIAARPAAPGDAAGRTLAPRLPDRRAGGDRRPRPRSACRARADGAECARRGGARGPVAVPAARHRRGDGRAAARDPRHRRMDGALHRPARGARDRCVSGQRHRAAPRRGRSQRARGRARPTAAGRAETWRPWRAYAAQHLWAADAAEGGRHG